MDFPSVYAATHSVEVISAEDHFGFVKRVEHVRVLDTDEPQVIECYYSKNGLYVGQHVDILLHYGITEQFESVVPESTIASIGFNPTEQKWYGWSHRMIHGFGIGSEVNIGDCAFVPSTKEEFEASLRRFWEDGVQRECGRGGEDSCVTEFTAFEHDEINLATNELGVSYTMETTFSSGRFPIVNSDFAPYPNPWGRGAHTATTLEEAKGMAIAFALSVA